MTYTVKEIFYTLQGEGARAGRPAVFCRFAGCNLWSGRESDRASAVCKFCDTDFVGVNPESGGRFADAGSLAQAIDRLWPRGHDASKYVVFTGGEPLLQLDEALVECGRACGFEVAVETNGTIPLPCGMDWVCVSPKIGTNLAVVKGNELKVIVPQVEQELSEYEELAFDSFYVQPMDGPDLARNTRQAIEFCKAHPKWMLSLQIHKILQIP